MPKKQRSIHESTSVSKNKKPQNRKERRRKLQAAEQATKESNRRGRPSIIIGILSILIGLIAFLFFVYPRLSIEPGESLDLHKPFETPFIIKNGGYWPLVDVNYEMTIDKMEDINQHRFINTGSGGIARTIPQLRPNEGSTIFINIAVSTPSDSIKYVELHINVTYKPYLIPFTFTENKRFKTNRKSNGEYVWFSAGR